MNRSFPGDPNGTSTQQVSAFVNDVLFPIGDVFLDLHSGGSSLDLIPSAIVEPVDDPVQQEKNIAAAVAFDAPIVVLIDNRGDLRTATAAAARAGLTVVKTEMAGGGAVSIDALALCRRGLRNVRGHLGVLPAPATRPSRNDAKIFTIPPNGFVLATNDCVFEPFHRNGVEVRAGEPAGRIHFLADPGREPILLRYDADGILYGRRQPGKVRPGNCCLVVAAPFRDR